MNVNNRNNCIGTYNIANTSNNNNVNDNILCLYNLLDAKLLLDYKNNNLSQIVLSNGNKNFCYVCCSFTHSISKCINLYLFRGVNKYPRFKNKEIIDILENKCLCKIHLDGKVGYIISKSQKDEIQNEYNHFVSSRGINPYMPYLFRNVKMFHYSELGKNKDKKRVSAFVLAEMIFDYLHPDLVKCLINIGLL